MLPDPITKRDLLWAAHKTPPDYGAAADEMLAAGWLADATEFAAKASDPARMRRVLEAALREGDASLVVRIAALAPDIVDSNTWRNCAGTAETLQKWQYARLAWEKAGDGAKAGAARLKVLAAMGYAIPKSPEEKAPTA